jgi:hypothetical protein
MLLVRRAASAGLCSAIQSFSGTFTVDQFDPAGNSLAHLAGDVTGTRVTVNTTVDQVL